MSKYYDKLTVERKLFLGQLKQLIENEFEEQKITRDNRGGCSLPEMEREEALENNIRTISINASWGMGKSFFAKALKTKLETSGIKVFNFNAWKNDYHKEPLKSLIGELNEQMKFGSDVKEKADKLIKNVLKEGSKVLISTLLKHLKISNEDLDGLKEIFSEVSESSLDEYKKYKKVLEDFKIALEEKCIFTEETQGKKVIIIDELDRCVPNFSVELLEAVKHIFNVEGLIFIFLINKEQLGESVKNLYGDVNKGEGYFRKFFDLSLELPELNLEEYIDLEYQINLENGFSHYEDLNTLNRHIFFTSLDNLYLTFTAREINMMYRKYQIFLKSLANNEKNNITFSVLLGYYFIFKEKKADDFLKWLDENLKKNYSFDMDENPHFLFSTRLEINRKSFLSDMICTIQHVLSEIEYKDGINEEPKDGINEEPKDDMNEEPKDDMNEESKEIVYRYRVQYYDSNEKYYDPNFLTGEQIFYNGNEINYIHSGLYCDEQTFERKYFTFMLSLPLNYKFNTGKFGLMGYLDSKYNFITGN
ncbi:MULTISPECIES: KAP family P-loop NTPase fold protein [Psychrilyobacter]|uniref:KAP family P-loop NTPase fold protein n=1 Tax=Psychrilyobacter TaxID=623282 RepID=UPI0013144173|nr:MULTISPECIES: P-loop NTPase fold protein [Psychrilyobacter]MCS5421838.1 KAP family NTPase [Psychrilyobacter sp. S5]NDI77564.1 hypothetical protein [Psychrilyobacter piezotolerans]